MICLNSGVDTEAMPSSEATVDDPEDPGLRNVLDNSDNRTSGLIILAKKGADCQERTSEQTESEIKRHALNQQHAVIYNNRPFYVLNIERMSL
jgi:hypothetical protein